MSTVTEGDMPLLQTADQRTIQVLREEIERMRRAHRDELHELRCRLQELTTQLDRARLDVNQMRAQVARQELRAARDDG